MANSAHPGKGPHPAATSWHTDPVMFRNADPGMSGNSARRMDSDARPVWITGARGLIVHHLVRLASEQLSDRRILPIPRRCWNFTDVRAVHARFEADRPGLVFHCAAMSWSPACQGESGPGTRGEC